MTDEQKQIIIDYKTALDSDHGRRVLADLRKWSGYDDRIIPQGLADVTAFELGRRDMFLHIMDKMNADLDQEVQTEAEDAAD